MAFFLHSGSTAHAAPPHAEPGLTYHSFNTLREAPAGFGLTLFHQPSDAGSNNTLAMGDKTYAVDKDWRPLAFSMNGKVDPASVAFAGYGIVAPAGDDVEEYDSYVHMDVKGKWVIVLRYVPENVDDMPMTCRYHAYINTTHNYIFSIIISNYSYFDFKFRRRYIY